MLKFVALLAAVYALMCAFICLLQRALIYHPTPDGGDFCGEVVSLPVSGAVLRILVMKRPGPAAVIYFGGNAESVVVSAADFVAAVPDRTWVFVNYRGYGGSSGTPSETSLVADAGAVFDWLHHEHPDIAVVGRSLGSGVAMQLAVARPLTRLVLVTPFDSLVNVGQRALPWVPVSWLLKDRYESARFAPRVATSTLVLIAGEDRVIAPALARHLVAAFKPGVVTAIDVPDAGHNDIQLWPKYYAAVAEFLAPGR